MPTPVPAGYDFKLQVHPLLQVLCQGLCQLKTQLEVKLVDQATTRLAKHVRYHLARRLLQSAYELNASKAARSSKNRLLCRLRLLKTTYLETCGL
jgi:hypothetical protein